MSILLQATPPRDASEDGRPVTPAPVPDRTLPVSIDAKGNYGVWVIVLLVVLVAGAAIAANYFIRRAKPPKWQSQPPAETDSEAFERLCEANRLTRRERELMLAAVRRRNGPEALGLFIDPVAFDELSAECSADVQVMMAEIRQKLF